MILISYLMSFLVLVFALSAAFYFIKDSEYIPLISWSFLSVGLIYGLGSIVVFYATHNGVEYTNSDLVLRAIGYWWIHGFLTLLLMFGMTLGWIVSIGFKSQYARVANRTFDLTNKGILTAGVILLIIGVSLRYLYTQKFGGFLDYLDYNRAVRSGLSEVNNPFSFLKPFGALVFFASYFFWALLLSKYKRFMVSVGFLVAFLCSLYVQFSNAGRVGFIVYLANFGLAYMYIKNIRPRVILSVSLLVVPLSFVLIFIISNYFQIKGTNSITYFVVKEISHLYQSFFAQLTEGYLYRGFVDFIMAPIHLLPSSWTVGIYETATETNTALLMGAKKGEQGVTSGIPVDLVTLGIMQLNGFGVFIVGMLFGWFIRRIEYFVSLISSRPLMFILLSYVSMRLAFLGVLYSHPEHFVSGLFPLIVLLVFLYALCLPTRIKIKYA